MKILASFLLLAVMTACSQADTPADAKLTSQVSDILKEWSALKPGTTRAELLKVFTTEGGLFDAAGRRFVSRRCPYIKVDVRFILTEPDQKVESPTDTIKSISRPFLEWSIID